ncbi:hypothetical protein BGZ63DRAFT_410530 [Mariannaea sp. PMI_226]|nr:hypothetical protein BGZ63DRAFT_410530 [Mariannaea sp. PMI_226]
MLAPLTFDKPSDLRIVLVPEDGKTTSLGQVHLELDKVEVDLSEMHVSTDQSIPQHPVPAMQEAFAESLLEVTNSEGGAGKPKLRELDAKGRRERLIEQGAEDEPFDATWRYRPGQEQHEVCKLISQITFGVYLLLNGLAADNTQVVSILQGHIDEVDEFLEVMIEDFAQAHLDLSERISLLQLPMANRQAFEDMLEDRNFRAQILTGNERIDHILARTNAAMKQWDGDIDAGLRSSEAFMEWLNKQKIHEFPMSKLDLSKIYQAMKGNADGWLNAFDDLNNQAQELNGLVIKMTTIVAEMEKTAGEISRKTWANIPPFSIPPQSDEASSPQLSDEPLPQVRPLSSIESIRSGESADTIRASSFQDPEVGTLSDFPLPGSAPLPGSTPLLPPLSDVSSLSDFPLPGAAPLLPPVRMVPTSALSPVPVLVAEELPTLSPTVYSGTPKLISFEPKKDLKNGPKKEPEREREREPEPEPSTPVAPPAPAPAQAVLDDGPLFILQPRTYTPVIPEPLPSPMIKNGSPPEAKTQTNAQLRPPSSQPQARPLSRPQTSSRAVSSHGFQPRVSSLMYPPPQLEIEQDHESHNRTSLRQRVSMKTTPPNLIHIPPRNPTEAMSSRPPTASHTPVSLGPQAPGAHASDLEVYHQHQHRLPRASSHADFSSVPVRPPLMPSPHSEQQQYYHPVLASPHSPLQQRPYTADPRSQQFPASGYFPGHLRQQPSRLGGQSTLSTVTSATYDDRATYRSRPTTHAGNSRLKKKKSAFGWLKKAFSLDEDERVEYQARKAMQYQNNYYETNPKFLDGKRLR